MRSLPRHGVLGVLAAILVALASLTASGCASEERPVGPGPTVRRAPARADRLATIGIAQGLLHETDVLEGLGRRDEAIARAERVLALELAADDPLREPLRLDAHGRLAELELASDHLDAADRWIERGLAEVHGRTPFEARLHLVHGRVLEARAAVHRAAGEGALADADLRAALEAHERSIAINEGLLAGRGDAP